jgi:hypothetical protein
VRRRPRALRRVPPTRPAPLQPSASFEHLGPQTLRHLTSAQTAVLGVATAVLGVATDVLAMGFGADVVERQEKSRT